MKQWIVCTIWLSYIYIYIIYIYIYTCYILYILVKRRYQQNLPETFYIVTNNFMLYLRSDPQAIRNIMKKIMIINEELELYLLKQFFLIALGKMQLWWYVFVIWKIELILMSTFNYHFIVFIEQIIFRENDVKFVCKIYHVFFWSWRIRFCLI